MEAEGVDVLLLSIGPDLPYLTAYAAMPLERLTMFVLPRDGDATLVVPRLEAPRVVERPEVFSILPWGETEDPIDLVAHLAKGAGVAAIGDHTWARFLVDLLASMPTTTFRRGTAVMSPLRSRKDDAEIDALRAAGAAADRVAAQLQSGAIPLVGRTEAQVSIDISQRLIDEGHQKVNFAIVAAGENAASPHHHAADRVIRAGEVVLCDFGGTMNGYCCDITRCVSLGDAAGRGGRRLRRAARGAAGGGPAAGGGHARARTSTRRARRIIAAAGWGEQFLHRTGHGIGMEEHEDPYIVEGNAVPLAPGHAFSIEPGIYVAGRWGMRLEDILVAADAGPEAMNRADHDLVVVDA